MLREPTVLNKVRRPITLCREYRLSAEPSNYDQVSGISQVQLAEKAGVSLGVIRRLELAETEEDLMGTPVGTFLKVSKALEVAPSVLWPRLNYWK